MAPTIRDVAKAAGVSLKTVSRVINNEPRVQVETRERVLRSIKALDFQPNPLARSLVTKQTYTLGLIVPDVANPFFAPGIDGCVAAAEQHGYNLFLASANDDPKREARRVQVLLDQHVAGIILWVSSLADAVLAGMMERARHSCHLVFIDRPPDPVSTARFTHNAVLVSQERIGFLATGHLLGEGRRRVAHLSVAGSDTGGWVADQRLQGYFRALREHGHEPHDESVHRAMHATIREGLIAASTLLAQRPCPDAIFAYNDLLAVGALMACKRLGLRVPEDVAIIGVDDTQMAAVTDPPLSTIRLHQYHTGERAVSLLLSLLGTGAALDRTSPIVATDLPAPDLIVRRSSSPRSPAIASPDDLDAQL
jgi:LacI family transcriptional regulator